jgi:hypothetical protein
MNTALISYSYSWLNLVPLPHTVFLEFKISRMNGQCPGSAGQSLCIHCCGYTSHFLLVDLYSKPFMRVCSRYLLRCIYTELFTNMLLYYDHDRTASTSQTEHIRSIDQCIRDSCAPSQDGLSSKYVCNMCAQISHVNSRFVHRKQH